jgi:hypothetical protein
MVSLDTPRLDVLAELTGEGELPEPPEDAVEDVLEELPLLQPAAMMSVTPVAARARIRKERLFQPKGPRDPISRQTALMASLPLSTGTSSSPDDGTTWSALCRASRKSSERRGRPQPTFMAPSHPPRPPCPARPEPRASLLGA